MSDRLESARRRADSARYTLPGSDEPPTVEECEAAARLALERGYTRTIVYGDDADTPSAGPVRPDEEPT